MEPPFLIATTPLSDPSHVLLDQGTVPKIPVEELRGKGATTNDETFQNGRPPERAVHLQKYNQHQR